MDKLQFLVLIIYICATDAEIKQHAKRNDDRQLNKIIIEKVILKNGG